MKGKKLFVLGVDALDPRLTKFYLDQDLLPNIKKFMELGSTREDLVMLGAHPTVTPPMWTTLATGAYANTHGIVGFNRRNPDHLGVYEYNMDSRNCKAEPLWNVLAEAGKKTLVFHWPGSSWPPTSDNPNLHVVDGTQPTAVNMGIAHVEGDFILVGSTEISEVTYKAKATSDTNVPCMITDLKVADDPNSISDMSVKQVSLTGVVLNREDGQYSVSKTPFDVVLTPIRDAKNWLNAPEGAKEFTMLFAHGTVRCLGLILPNDNGVYDQVALYRSKKEEQPFVTLANNVFTSGIIVDTLHEEKPCKAIRNMRVLEIGKDGNYIKMFVSAALDISRDDLWHPKHLYKIACEKAGYPLPEAFLGGADPVLIKDCTIASWDKLADWHAGAIHALMEAEDYDMVFSHFHSVDAIGHMIIRYLHDKGEEGYLGEDVYEQFLRDTYIQADRYIGKFLHLLDEGWTVFLVSDHGQVCPEHDTPMLFDGAGIDVRVMEELGFTTLKYDADGNELREIDWSKTKAIASGMYIYLNIKGRDEFGIVEPEDQYELEEEIMTALYGYRDKKTNKRIVSLALRNKDAILIGLGGPECGDIVITSAEGYNYDHADSLSTTYGYAHTSVSPIFLAAGPGIKKNHLTERVIRQVDLTPTMALLAGVRMPAQCEGAPIYQILEDDLRA